MCERYNALWQRKPQTIEFDAASCALRTTDGCSVPERTEFDFAQTRTGNDVRRTVHATKEAAFGTSIANAFAGPTTEALEVCTQIEIGGRLAPPPLSHHPACLLGTGRFR